MINGFLNQGFYTKQQLKAYDLIDKMLRCSNGQELEILLSPQDLTNPAFLRVMLQVTEQFQKLGNHNQVAWQTKK